MAETTLKITNNGGIWQKKTACKKREENILGEKTIIPSQNGVVASAGGVKNNAEKEKPAAGMKRTENYGGALSAAAAPEDIRQLSVWKNLRHLIGVGIVVK